MASIQKTYNSMGLPMNINRSNPIPVDNTELWYSLEEAQAYAASGATAYVGQSIKVIDEATGNIDWYIIGIDGSLITSTPSEIPSENVVHGNDKLLLSSIIDTYILNIDYENLLAFDTTEIVFGSSSNSTTAELGKAILGQMVLGG